MTEQGDGSRRAPRGGDGPDRGDSRNSEDGPDGGDGRQPVPGDATAEDGAAYRSDGGVDATPTGHGERVPGGSTPERVAVGGCSRRGPSPQADPSRERVTTGDGVLTEGREVTVLHVDDDPDVGELVSYFVEEVVGDVTVVTETDPAAALDLVARVDADCVVSDLEMPDMDGLELALAVDATHPDVPVVLFTARDWKTVDGEAGADCVTAHVRKESGHKQFERLARHVRTLVD